VDEMTMSVGLLMESVQGQQKLAAQSLERLSSITGNLDVVVRGELRQAFVEEFQAVRVACREATDALQRVGRSANLRLALWMLGMNGLLCAVPIIVAGIVVPSRAEIVALRREREELTAVILRLQQQGGRVELRHCGESRRLCVRVERSTPAFGATADYLILKGY
jgi:hypothetical protein